MKPGRPPVRKGRDELPMAELEAANPDYVALSLRGSVAAPGLTRTR